MRDAISRFEGLGLKGHYDLALLDRHAGWRDQADAWSGSLEVCAFFGKYGLEHYNGRDYAKAK